MKILWQFHFTFLGVLVLVGLVYAQDQSGFITLDCGLAANTTYTDETTTLNYISDSPFISTGITKSIALEFASNTLRRPLRYVRSFPEGGRNCYNITLAKDTEYLIRAVFLYGNYDGLNKLPEFELHIGPNKWVTVELSNTSFSFSKEIIIHSPKSKYIHVCLVNTNSGTPFISALEIRPLKNGTYVPESGSVGLALFTRDDEGSLDNKTVRYPDDVYDRRWIPNHYKRGIDISTTQTVDLEDHTDFQPPSIVMRSAVIPINSSNPFGFYISNDILYKLYVYMHFSEIVQLEANQSRRFNISLNGEYWYGPVTPPYLYTTTVYTTSAITEGMYEFTLIQVEGSTLPPLINAVELYYVVDLLQSETNQADVIAIMNIKSTYRISRTNWQGDPCAPKAFVWEGVECNYNVTSSPVITSLNLSSSGLNGEIAPDIANLKSLESLDLSNNNLTGPVPDFLSRLQFLKVLNLTGNRLSGTIPDDLLKRSDSGLTLRVDENLCKSVSCNKKKKDKKKTGSIVPVVVASVAAFIVIVVLTIIWFLKRRNQKVAVRTEAHPEPKATPESKSTHEPLELKKRQFTYSDILKITNNFQSALGRGGFGTVYHGYLDEVEVAVKMLSASSIQGYKEFQAEVKLLLRVHHKNLTALVGYCDEGNNMGLIYEYMSNGNLKHLLSGNHPNVLSWEGRLQIALEAAQGLEYLHNGCKPPIVHRDVKTTNILLNDKFQAKLADFGLSRTFPVEGGTHVSTIVAGTPGYLDPDYYVTNWLTEKSDVYSFGVVLLEIITSRSVIEKTQERIHLSKWVKSLLEKGDIKNVVDPRLHGDFDNNSVWKVAELAMACVSSTSAERPSMSQVVMELNDCLTTEMARTREGRSTQSTNSVELLSLYVHTGSPLAR